jgi:GTP-binding protein
MAPSLVAIIGRPNVGKSTFFNRVLGERRAVVHDRPGITRDRNMVRAEWAGRAFLLVDTGGFLPAAAEGRDALVRRQAELAVSMAGAVVFMVDGRTGPTDLDRAIARSLRRHDRPCLLVVNKVDKPGDPMVHEFHRLGLGEPIPISSENGFGIGDLLDRIVAELPPETEEEAPTAGGRIAIVGRPNVGKSSLVNALLGEERMVVEPQPGTTVDSVDSPWRTDRGSFTLVDTAGIRRQAHFPDEAEYFASMRALQSMQRADLACLVVDSTRGFERQEARIAWQALESGCTVQLVYNKWDLMDERDATWKRLTTERDQRFPTLAGLPALPVSAIERLHLGRLPAALAQRAGEHARKLTTPEINRWLAAVQRRRQVPSTRLGRVAKIYYATQTGSRPPEITLFCNAPSRLSDPYRRYLLLDLCDTFEFHGTPVRLKFRKSE